MLSLTASPQFTNPQSFWSLGVPLLLLCLIVLAAVYFVRITSK